MGAVTDVHEQLLALLELDALLDEWAIPDEPVGVYVHSGGDENGRAHD